MKKIILNLIGIAFFIMLSINFSNGQNDCEFVPPQETMEAPGYVDGPLYIKLYLVIIKDDNGYCEYWKEDKIEEYIQLLENVFNEHDIYFNICVSEIRNSEYYLNGYSGGQIYDDGLNGILQQKAGGSSSFPPEKIFYADNVYTAIHEIGHDLGLYHTFENIVNNIISCNEHAPYEDSNGNWHWGDNASSEGDLVYDTPADMTATSGYFCPHTGEVSISNCMFHNPDHITDELGHEYTDYEDPGKPGKYYLANNIMEYYNNTCRSLITPGQAERIREQITLEPEVIQDEPKTIVYSNDVYIFESQTWDKDKVINGNVYLRNGTLDLRNCNLYFTPGHGLEIAPGAFLNIEYSTIDVKNDDYCGDYQEGNTWSGILYDFSLSNSGVPWVIMKNSTIRNAEKAFSNNSFYMNPFLVLRVYGQSEFIDNKISVDLTNAEGIIWFDDTDFILNKEENISNNQAILINSKGSFINCNFINNTNEFEIENGFTLYNSNLRLNEVTFNRWNNGIKRYAGISKFLRIFKSHFLDNNYGINQDYKYKSVYVNSSEFNNNFFSGIVSMNHSKQTDYSFISNSFKGGENGIKINRGIYGYFKNNIFDDITEDALYFKNRGTSTKKALFLCNQMNSTGTGHIITYGGIAPVQASVGEDGIVRAAGNTFVAISGYNFAAHSNIKPVYLYYKDNPAEYPVNHIGINLQWTSNAAKCSENPYDDDDGDGGGLGDGDTSDEDNRYTEKKGEKDNTQDTLDTNLDGGNTDDVIDLIDNVTEETSDDVAQTLTELGPWLSDLAAEEVLQYADAFTGDELVSIFSASPDVLLDPVVYQFAFGENSTLAQYQQDALHSVYGTLTDRTRLEVKLRYLDEYISHIINQAISKVVFTDDGIVDYDNLRMWFDRKGTYDSKFDIAETYVTQGDFDGAVSYLQGVLTQSGLSTDQIQEVNDYIAIFNLLDNAYQTSRYEGQLTTDEISQLESFANTSTGLAQNKAQGILNFFYGYTFDDEEEMEERSREFKKPRVFESMQNVEVNPNPADGKFAIELKGLPVDIAISNVKVLTFEGKVIFDKNFKDKLQKVNIALDNTKSGIYLYKVLDTSGKIHLGKLILNSK